MEPMKYMRWLAACLLAVSMAGTAWAAPSDQLLQEEELDVQSVYTQLLDLSKEELLADTKRAFALAGQGEQSGDEGILVPWTAALAQRLGEFQPEELADEILNGENEESYRAALIQLVEQDGRGADSRLYSMMMDSSQSAYLRGSLALHLPMETQQHRALLEQLATGQDALAEYAAMRLEWLEREDVLASYTWEGQGQTDQAEDQPAGIWNVQLLGVVWLAAAGTARFGGKAGGGIDPLHPGAISAILGCNSPYGQKRSVTNQ